MTSPATSPVRRVSRRAGAPPCDPTTLDLVCKGTCGRQMHARRPKGESRATCADRHPVVDTDGLCASCATLRRRAAGTAEPRTPAAPRGAARTYCTHDEGEPCNCGETT